MALPTITELRKLARKRSAILRASESGLIKKAKSQERKLNKYVLDTLLPSFDINCLADGEIEHLAEIAIDCFPIGQWQYFKRQG